MHYRHTTVGTAKDAQIAPMGAILPGGKIRPFPRCFSAVLTDYVDRNGQRLDTRSRARVLLPPAVFDEWNVQVCSIVDCRESTAVLGYEHVRDHFLPDIG